MEENQPALEEDFLTEDEDIEDGDYGDSYELDYGEEISDFDDDE
jgi:hypothetical protein